MKEKYIFLIGFLLVMGYVLFGLAFPDPLDEICKPNKDFKNIYGLSDEDFKVLSIAQAVQSNIQFNNNGFAPKDRFKKGLERRWGNCDTMSIILNECLNREGIKNDIIVAYYLGYNNGTLHHTFIMVGDKILDVTEAQIHMVNLYRYGLNRGYGYTAFWYGVEKGVFKLK